MSGVGNMPPDWAVDSACDKLNAEAGVELYSNWRRMAHSGHPTVVAFARYIAEHEQAPVDPLLIEARVIAGRIGGWLLPYTWSGHSIINEADGAARERDCPAQRYVSIALAALRRGIEIAKGGES